ncbi:hypothetical protein BGW38_004165 [Lunasporangiospora selenospora]|uniref:Uncharacterized protein n=1 Tax=Lunasporangiospora selenospora TaxID=979761 RepID=A0A9P6G2A3_9FUNG|nr:hypothetical protein BGW38_004165 [Lunasporangiospora selenospora]
MDGDGGNTHVLLIQSNPSPPHLESVAWELVSSQYMGATGIRDDQFTVACHADPETGIFALISMFEKKKTSASPGPWDNNLLKLQPGGILFDSSLGKWINFTLSADYRWGDSYLKPNSFILFQPQIPDNQPSTTTSLPSSIPTPPTLKPLPHSALFFHANIGSGNTVNIGLLPNDGTYKMINWEQWELDPQTYGYPVLLAFARKSLFQLGTTIGDYRTGDRNFFLTRIPIRDNFAFIPTSNYPAIPLPGFTCDAESMMAKSYRDHLYIICVRPSNKMVVIKDEDNAVPTISHYYGANEFYTFQPIGGDLPGQDPFLYCPSSASIFGAPLVPSKSYEDVSFAFYPVNITENFGYNHTEEYSILGEAHTELILGTSVSVIILFSMVIFYRPIRRRWPRWKARWKKKMMKQISSDNGDNHGDEETMDMRKQAFETDCEESTKIEIPSRDNSNEFEGQDKILVTCDDDLVGVMNLTDPLATQEDDTTDRYMGDLDLDYHPQPTVVTSHAQDDVEAVGSTSISLRESLPVPKPTPALLVAPPTAIVSGKEQLALLLSPLPSNYTLSALPSAPLANASDYPLPPPPNNHHPLSVQIIPRHRESTDIPSSSSSNNAKTSQHKMDGRRQNTDTEDVDEEDRVPPYVKQPDLSILPLSASHLEQHLPSAPSLAAIESEVSTAELGSPPSLPSTVPSTDSASEQITRIEKSTNSVTVIQEQEQEQAQEQEQEPTGPKMDNAPTICK